jgi:hypothetical protein
MGLIEFKQQTLSILGTIHTNGTSWSASLLTQWHWLVITLIVPTPTTQVCLCMSVRVAPQLACRLIMVHAYLSLQHSAPAAPPPPQRASFDLLSTRLHSCLGADPPPTGVTHALLNLVPLSQPPSPPTDPLLSHCPSFPLAPTALRLTHSFSLPMGPDIGRYGWVLNFRQGIVMSQSHVLELELDFSCGSRAGPGPRWLVSR